jgi:hypothetical protein
MIITVTMTGVVLDDVLFAIEKDAIQVEIDNE